MKTRKQLQAEVNELKVRLEAAGSENRKALRAKLHEQVMHLPEVING